MSHARTQSHYKNNYPYIMLVCGNTFQDCQIELTSASIATRLGVRPAFASFLVFALSCAAARLTRDLFARAQGNATAGNEQTVGNATSD